MSAKKVLVVEDHKKIMRFMRANLAASGFEVYTAADGKEALQKYERYLPDIVLLDIILPRLDGYEVLREIRKFSDVPVIIITAKGDASDAIKGLELGADDYIVKPFDINELLARIKAVLRRVAKNVPEQKTSITVGPLSIDTRSHIVNVDNKAVKLTPTEFKLLTQLARDKGCVLTHEELLTSIWGAEYRDETHYLRVCVARIRQKTGIREGREGYIETIPTVGYRMITKQEA